MKNYCLHLNQKYFPASCIFPGFAYMNMTSPWELHCFILPCMSIVNFEQVNAGWENN